MPRFRPKRCRSSVIWAMPAAMESRGLRMVTFLPFTSTSMWWQGSAPEMAAHNLRAPRADHAGQAENFAPAHRKVDARGVMGELQVAHFEHDFADFAAFFLVEHVHRAANHVLGDVVNGHIAAGIVVGADNRAIADDGNAVGNLHHFLEEVRNVNHRDALRWRYGAPGRAPCRRPPR